MKTLLTLGLACMALGASAQLKEAIDLTEKEQFEKADAAFKAIIKADPQNGEAWFQMGENYFANDRTDSAKAAYGRGVDVAPSYPLNYVGLGKVLFSAGNIAKTRAQAQTMFTKAMEMAEAKVNKYSKQQVAATYREVAEGMLAGPTPDYVGALTMMQKAIDLYPKDPAVYILKGDALFDQNPRDGSAPLANYKIAMDLEPLSARPVARKAFMYYRAKNFPASIEEYGRAIALEPGFAPAYRGRAEAYFMARDFDKATADMRKYLELNVGNTTARVRNAQFLFLVKKYDESLAEIQALEQEGVKNVTLMRLKAFDLAEKGEHAQADAALKAYFTEQPTEKVIGADWEYAAKISQGLAKLQAIDTLSQATRLNHDSLAGELYLKAAKLDAGKDYLLVEAAKAFADGKAYGRAIAAMREKTKVNAEVNDWYYLGAMANRARMYSSADSAWTQYIAKQPNIYQGYLYRARARAGVDTAEVKDWKAKGDYEEVIRKMKPEEVAGHKADLEEAYNYMGLYWLYNQAGADRAQAKCWFLKVSELNAGTSITQQVNNTFLKMKELKDLAPSPCELPAQP
jgi:tetratricopeptide (TPR) repeat protein